MALEIDIVEEILENTVFKICQVSFLGRFIASVNDTMKV